MNHSAFSKIIEMPNLIFDNLDWTNADFDNLKQDLNIVENYFRDEISNNLFGSSQLFKNDLIKHYFHSISEIYLNYLFVNFDEDEINSIKLLKIFKDYFQEIIDIVCFECIKYNIDAISIANENLISNSILNLHVFEEAKWNSFLDSSKGETKLKTSFTSIEAFDFFNHLNKEFYKGKSNLTKYSCIYVKMQSDKFIDADLKPDEFKKLIGKSPYNIEINHYLKSLHSLPKKAKQDYENIKIDFFKSLEKQ